MEDGSIQKITIRCTFQANDDILFMKDKTDEKIFAQVSMYVFIQFRKLRFDCLRWNDKKVDVQKIEITPASFLYSSAPDGAKCTKTFLFSFSLAAISKG